MNTIPKDEAERKMKAAGYDCSVIDGVLTFSGEYSAKEVKKIAGILEHIGYSASWAIQTKRRMMICL